MRHYDLKNMCWANPPAPTLDEVCEWIDANAEFIQFRPLGEREWQGGITVEKESYYGAGTFREALMAAYAKAREAGQ